MAGYKGNDIYLLVGLVGAFGIANLGLEVVAFLLDKVLVIANLSIIIYIITIRILLTRMPMRYAHCVSVPKSEKCRSSDKI